MQTGERVAQQSRALDPAVVDPLFLCRRPPPEDVFTREMNDGVRAFEAGAIDRAALRIPCDRSLARRRMSPDERHDLVVSPFERYRQRGADQAGRPADHDFHSGRIASASISTSMVGSTSCFTATSVDAGRMSRKTSPCARPTACQCSMFVTYMRVRTTSPNPPPACSSAR